MWWAQGGHKAAEVIIKLFTMQTHQCPRMALLLMYCNQYAHYLTSLLCKLSAFKKCVLKARWWVLKGRFKWKCKFVNEKSCYLTHIRILAKVVWAGTALAQQTCWKTVTYFNDSFSEADVIKLQHLGSLIYWFPFP